MKFTPWDYQTRAVQGMVSHACYGDLDDPGLGKTITVLTAFEIMRSKGLVKKILVVAPLRPAYMVWPREVLKWDHTCHLSCSVLHGSDKGSKLADGSDIHVINPEGLAWLFDQPKRPKYDVLVIDESTRFKHPGTQRFKILKPHLNSFRRRYILTGSPSPNGLLDLFGQIYILDQGNALGRYITHYRSEYFDSSGFGGYTFKPKYGAEARIQAKIAPMVIRRRAKDYLDLPDLVGACGEGEPLISRVTLPPKAMETYLKMEKLLIAEVDKDVVSAANAAAAAGKCRQIANGGLYGTLEPGEDRTAHIIHEEKLDATEELIEEMSGVPCLVAYEFDHDRQRLQGRFKKAPYIGGGVTPKRFREIEEEWNKGNIEVLLAQPQSVAHGLNLQATRANVIWHSLTWDLENYEQFIRRVWRQGQKHKVFVHHIVAEKTIDEKILKMLQKKDRSQQSLLNALKEQYRRKS